MKRYPVDDTAAWTVWTLTCAIRAIWVSDNTSYYPVYRARGLCFKRSTSTSNWNLQVLVFAEGGKPENPEKTPRRRERANNKLSNPAPPVLPLLPYQIQNTQNIGSHRTMKKLKWQRNLSAQGLCDVFLQMIHSSTARGKIWRRV